MSGQHEQDEHDEAARAEKSAVDEVFAELRRESQAHAKDLVDLDHAELRLAFETFAMKLSRHGVVVPSIHGPTMILRVADLYLLDITERLTHQVKLRVRAEQREAEAKSQVADLALGLLGANHQHEKTKAELMSAMDSLVEARDSRERLENELVRLRTLLLAKAPRGDGQAERAQSAPHEHAVAVEPPLTTLPTAPAPAPEPSLDTSPAAHRWRLAPALLERLPEALQHLKVLRLHPSLYPGMGADALCVAPDGAHWVVLHEDYIEGEADEPDRQMISVRSADEHGKPFARGAYYYAVPCLPADQLPVVVPDVDPVLPG